MEKRIVLAAVVVLIVIGIVYLYSKPDQQPNGAQQTALAVGGQNGSLPASSCKFPADPPSPTAGLAAFDDYGWKMFVAMNWPVEAGQRGVPDCSKPIGSSTDVVWTSYKFSEEIFLKGAADPGPWNSPAGNMPMRLVGISKVFPIVAKQIQSTITQPVGGWLIDQKGNPTYYQIAVDETSYNYVRSNKFYNLDVVQGATKVDFPDMSLEIKASWRHLTKDDDADRYFTRPALFQLYDSSGKPVGQPEAGTAGLVGLHIIVKAKGYPQWIWATFEQVDNVTATGPVPASYNDPNCTGPYCSPPNQSPLISGQPFDSPNQVTRLTSLYPEAIAANTKYQSALKGTPFQYYHLVTTQYPTDPDDPGNPLGTPTPNVAANTTMESYIQDTSSCMACHSTARVPGGTQAKTDFSFILLHAQPPAN